MKTFLIVSNSFVRWINLPFLPLSIVSRWFNFNRMTMIGTLGCLHRPISRISTFPICQSQIFMENYIDNKKIYHHLQTSTALITFSTHFHSKWVSRWKAHDRFFLLIKALERKNWKMRKLLDPSWVKASIISLNFTFFQLCNTSWPVMVSFTFWVNWGSHMHHLF